MYLCSDMLCFFEKVLGNGLLVREELVIEYVNYGQRFVRSCPVGFRKERS